MLKKIEELNKQIDSLMVKKTKADAQKEVWETRLNESIVKYAKEYGVDLSGKSFKDVKVKLAEEIRKVESQTAEEFEKSQKLVTLIQNGDIKGAWKELGVDLDAVEKEEEVIEEVKDESGSGTDEGLQSASEVFNELEDLDDNDFLGSEVEKSEAELAGFEDMGSDSMEIEVDEDDDDEGIESNLSSSFIKDSRSVYNPREEKKEEVKKPAMFLSFDDDEDDDDDFIVQPSVETSPKAKGGMVIEEDDDDGEDDFAGFGSILKGSKFQI